MRRRIADLDLHPLDIRRLHPFWVEDREIEGDVYHRIATDGQVRIGDLRVRADHGVVTLTGTADTPYERARAEGLAKSIPSVVGVVNAITVGVDVPRARRKRNRALQDQALSQLQSSPDPTVRKVGIKVWYGVGTLYGRVASSAQEKMSMDAALRVHGMRDVVSRIKVGEIAPTAEPLTVADDATLQDWLASALSDAGITIFDGRVYVMDGIAYLEGMVFRPYERQMAETVAARVPGIQGVRNLLSVIGAERGQDIDEGLAARVSRELAENGQVSLHDIDVVVREGVVYLTGTVDSISDKDLAGRIARRVAGVRKVVNNLVVLGRSGLKATDRRPVLFSHKVGWRRL